MKAAGGVFSCFLALLLLTGCGQTVYKGKGMHADFSDTQREGVVAVSLARDTGKRMRLRVTRGEEGTAYLYEMDASGTPARIPLTEGGGEYTLSLFEQQEGNLYLPADETTVTLRSEEETLPFRSPNVMVNYEENGSVAETAKRVTEGIRGEDKIIEALLGCVLDTLSYDREKFLSAESTYIPDTEELLESRSGFCFDYAALFTALCRVSSVPCRMVFGDANGKYHAWCEVYCRKEGEIVTLPHKAETWVRLDPTFLDEYDCSEKILMFMSNPDRYKEEFYY